MILRGIVLLLSVFALSGMAQLPTASITVPSATLCTGKPIRFNSVTTNTPTTFSWSVTPSYNGTLNPNNSGTFIDYTFSNAGAYIIRLVVANTTGSMVTTRTVVVTQAAQASFNASLVTQGYPSQLQLTNFSSGSFKNYWIFSDVTPKDSSINTVKSYSTSGNYTVNLVALGTGGCNDTLSYRFRIADSSGVTLPNIFSPNEDGVNDIFKPITAGLTALKLSIFNRYGNLVFFSDRLNGFWDGRTTSGEPCSPGVYFYVVEATGFDGKSYNLKNTLTLIR